MDAKLVWTDAKPTVPGLYLHRLWKDTVPLQWTVYNIVNNNGILAHDVSEGEYESIINDGQFAGPIPQPEEPR